MQTTARNGHKRGTYFSSSTYFARVHSRSFGQVLSKLVVVFLYGLQFCLKLFNLTSEQSVFGLADAGR